MADDKKSISLGFASGLGTALKLAQDEYDKLLAAIEAEEKWVEVSEEKRVVKLRSDRVEFYAVDAPETEDRRAGF